MQCLNNANVMLIQFATMYANFTTSRDAGYIRFFPLKVDMNDGTNLFFFNIKDYDEMPEFN